MRASAKSNCYCYARDNDRLDENGFNSMKNKELNTLQIMDNMDPLRRKTVPQRFSANSTPLGDERVTELYIFPHSNIVDFTDMSCDDKV